MIACRECLPSLMLVVPSLVGGGAERNIVWLANRWVAAGGHASVVTVAAATDDAYTLDDAVERLALDLAHDSGGGARAVMANLSRLHALRRVMRAQRRAAQARQTPLVVVSFIVSANILSCLAATGLSIPVIVSERNHPPRQSLGTMWRRLRGPVYGLADELVALTERSAEWLRLHTRARRVRVIPNPVVLPLPSAPPVCLPDTVVPAGACYVLAAGSLQPQKGFDVLLQAWARVVTDWHLVIVGAGDAAALQAQAQALGVADRVHLPGRVGNLGDWYARASLFVLSSRYEGFPNVLVEALASGLPAISTDCETGPADIITHGVDGWLVASASDTALVGALQQLIDDAPLRRRLAEQGTTVVDRFDADRLFAAWQTLVGSHSRYRNPGDVKDH